MELTVSSFALPFRQPLKTASGEVSGQAGLLVRLDDGAGHVGWGQAVELPQAEANGLPAEIEYWNGETGAVELADDASLSNLPLTQIALSWALADISAQQAGLPLCRWLRREFGLAELSHEQLEVPVNALADPATVARTGELVREHGYQAVKLKVGSTDFDVDLTAISTLRKIIGQEVKLRLDANGAWSLPEASVNLSRLDDWDIDYIEEPVSGLEALLQLGASSPVPIAVDESIANIDQLREAARIIAQSVSRSQTSHSTISAIIVKPTVLGEIRSVFESLLGVQRLAESSGKEERGSRTGSSIRIIITSALDSSIGLAAAAHLALALGVSHPCGLDTARMLAGDLVDSPLISTNGSLLLPEAGTESAGLGVSPSEQRLAEFAIELFRGAVDPSQNLFQNPSQNS